MRHTLWLSVLLAACGLNPDQFEARFEAKFCTEYDACFDDFDCEENGPVEKDRDDCDFSAENGTTCLESDWICVTNQGLPFVSIPVECSEVYTNCGETTETITYTQGGGTAR